MSMVADGRLTDAPEFLKTASDKEVLQWMKERQRAKRRTPPLPEPVPPPPEDDGPRPSRWTAKKDAETACWQVVGPPEPPAAPAVFSAADLFASPAAVWHTMPNGARVAVHPLSVAEAITLNTKATEDFKKLPPGLSEPERNLYAHFLPQVWQVMMCCRESLDPTSPRIFKPEHVEVLLRNPGWLETVQAIVTKSDQAGGEEKALKEVLRGFFGATEAYLQTLLSQWNTASPETLREGLEGFVSCVSRMRSAGGTVTESDVEAVRSL